MDRCNECDQTYAYYNWCKPCCSKYFKNNFDKWTSGNEKIDKFIQDAQSNANRYKKMIEWISYNRFIDIKEIAKGGFSTIYYAKWVDGYIWKWDIENQQWIRSGQCEVALKKFDNFANLNKEFLNETTIHLKTVDPLSYSIRIYGITKDPETNKYMMVLEYMPDGNLRDYLKNNFDNINWNDKLLRLSNLALNFNQFHKLDIVHQDFHPGNILLNNSKFNLYISDFGLSRIVGQSLENYNKKNIFGVLPYIAPEVLCGEEYTKAADVYSFGIIAYELITGFAPYYDVPHDRDLARQICNGLRPKIPLHTPKLITRIIMRCWDVRVTHRPTFEELKEELLKCHDDYIRNDFKNNNEITIQIDNAEKFSKHLTNIATINPYNYQTHPQAIYTSRLLNYSGLPKPKNDENFEKELEEITKSTSALSVIASGSINMVRLSKIVGQNLENSNNRNIFGILPYIAPEVLRGEEYTKAADLFSFGIIVYEIITGFAPYYDMPHDRDLSRKICNGLRPKIPFHTPKLITRIIMRCWDSRVTYRPTFKELYEELLKYHCDYFENDFKNINEITIQIDNTENFSKHLTNTTINPFNHKTHPEAIYTSRLLNYSNLPKPRNDEILKKNLKK
ncbi:hypothetical protein Glove_21g48 [Diversispora epigaea]|uniref:Protein kinase domain-containing protein n=1 Tax=Diversispora epigaea TaxID=1348612 RepID=A0A397JS60_9GLOM|nr:hypothetical protein Glove_21g48 [Diversispora epigaea]